MKYQKGDQQILRADEEGAGWTDPDDHPGDPAQHALAGRSGGAGAGDHPLQNGAGRGRTEKMAVCGGLLPVAESLAAAETPGQKRGGTSDAVLSS